MSFKIICTKCGSENVQVSRGSEGVYFDCVNCDHQIHKKIIGYDKDGLFEYEDELIE